MSYVEGFVLAVPAANRERYREMAEAAFPVFRDHGALGMTECWGDDVPDGEVTSFPMAVKCRPDEVVVFAWIVWPSRQARDEGMAKAMADPRFDSLGEMPFDGKRMIHGGFEVFVEH